MNVSVEDVQQHLYVTLCMNGCIVAAPLCHFKRNCRCLYTANRPIQTTGIRDAADTATHATYCNTCDEDRVHLLCYNLVVLARDHPYSSDTSVTTTGP